jgi:hypothetical protein
MIEDQGIGKGAITEDEAGKSPHWARGLRNYREIVPAFI